jgi:hypothetical protein
MVEENLAIKGRGQLISWPSFAKKFTALYTRLLRVEHHPMDDFIRYGDHIRLRHEQTGAYLRSWDKIYEQPNNSRQQIVVCTAKPEPNTLWLVKGPYGQPENYKRGENVRSNDRIRLEHVQTGKNLHTHLDRLGPVTHGQHEVSCYKLKAGGDNKDDWTLIFGSGDKLVTAKQFRLRNAGTNEFLHSHLGISNFFTEMYQEVTAATANDENDFWVCESGDHRSTPKLSDLIRTNWITFLNIAAAFSSLTGWTIFTFGKISVVSTVLATLAIVSSFSMTIFIFAMLLDGMKDWLRHKEWKFFCYFLLSAYLLVCTVVLVLLGPVGWEIIQWIARGGSPAH